MTVWFADGEPPPVDTLAWLALALPLALAALVFYVGLTAVALSVDDDLARYLAVLVEQRAQRDGSAAAPASDREG